MKDDLHDLYKRWLAEADARLEAEREARLADTIAIHDLRAEVEREHEARLDAEHAAARCGIEVATLRGLLAERDAALDVEPCGECGQNCDECKAEAQ